MTATSTAAPAANVRETFMPPSPSVNAERLDMDGQPVGKNLTGPDGAVKRAVSIVT